MVTVTSGSGFDVSGHPRQPKNVSEEVGIQRRDDVTARNNIKELCARIQEYRNDGDAPDVPVTMIILNYQPPRLWTAQSHKLSVT